MIWTTTDLSLVFACLRSHSCRQYILFAISLSIWSDVRIRNTIQCNEYIIVKFSAESLKHHIDCCDSCFDLHFGSVICLPKCFCAHNTIDLLATYVACMHTILCVSCEFGFLRFGRDSFLYVFRSTPTCARHKRNTTTGMRAKRTRERERQRFVVYAHACAINVTIYRVCPYVCLYNVLCMRYVGSFL